MGFVSQLVTLIWLIVEQRAGAAGSNQAGALQGAGHGQGSAWDELGMPQGCAWQLHLHICKPWFHPKAAHPKAWGLQLSRLEGWSV